MKKYKCKDGRVAYELPKCTICGKQSNTTDKETAQIAERVGRICQDCTRKIAKKEGNFKSANPKFNQEYKAEFVDTKKKSIWQKIKRGYSDERQSEMV